MNAPLRPKEVPQKIGDQCPNLSIVIPCYNEAANLKPLMARLWPILIQTQLSFEVLLIDDGSTDHTFEWITQLAKEFPGHLHGLQLSKNMGHQQALSCGLDWAKGEAVITMDADLQHPPELIATMIQLWREQGYQIVNTQKKPHAHGAPAQLLLARLFYWIFNLTSSVQLTPHSSDFRLLDRKCVEALKKMPEYYKFYRGLVKYIGHKSIDLTIDVAPRYAGKRSYTFLKSLKLASDGLFSFSTFGLKIPFYLGLISLLLISAYFFICLGAWLFWGITMAPGWLSIILIFAALFALQMLFMGIFGLYLGKLYVEVKHRPVYFINQTTPHWEGREER